MNQRSKIGPTADEKSAWNMNDSEYTGRYQTFNQEQRGSAKPAAIRQLDNRDTFRIGDEILKDSSYMNDYAPKAADKVNRVKHKGGPSSIAAPQEAKMDCHSSYKNSFDKKDCRPAKAIKPPPPQGLGWKTDDESKQPGLSSVNMNSYRPYTANEVQDSKRKPIIISPEYGAIDVDPETRPGMEFQTTVKQNFVKHCGIFRPPPASGAIKTPAHGIAGIAGADINAKMDLTTTHQKVFSPKNPGEELVAVPPLQKDKEAKKPGWYTSRAGEDATVSTQTSDYVKHDGVRRPKSFQPLHVYNPPTQKFHDKTLYKGAFTIHGNNRRAPMIPAVRTKDDEIIKSVCASEDVYHTEYNATYQTNKAVRPAKPIVPKNTNRSSGKFYDKTSYAQNFHCSSDRKMDRMPSFKPKKLLNPWYKANEDTAETLTSTTREHYQGDHALPATICRPKINKDQMNQNEREVHFDTEYNVCFQKTEPVAAATTS
jgi:hypothetical protein